MCARQTQACIVVCSSLRTNKTHPKWSKEFLLLCTHKKTENQPTGLVCNEIQTFKRANDQKCETFSLRHSQSEIAFLEKNGPEHFAKMFSSLKKRSHKLAMVDEVLHDNLNPTPLGTRKSNSHHLQLTVWAMICCCLDSFVPLAFLPSYYFVYGSSLDGETKPALCS